MKIGVYSTNINFDRKSSSANINGVTGSVWDIHTFQEYDRITGTVTEQVTRVDANYSAQKLLSYGPLDDSGFSVGVSLSGITSPVSWSFSTGAASTNNTSSIASKYGRWIWTASVTTFGDPFVTEPGIRVSNTSGSLAVKFSHTFGTNYGSHGTGVVTASIPDR
ncbi:hypothetical protein SAMN05192533_11789 [Mesobacillus persicus]|uniref:Uncharacterized protein n=1 Tax=Mesobacillus persicus TaxID=930146 RepID=A0A1H8IKJ4_9BACI|nr:hypothetical protein SAMN05192533_11789 [Mesobacillus persicus]